MPRIHTVIFAVRAYECDAYGHVNNAVYLRYMQEAAFQASAAAGYDQARYAEMQSTWLIRDTEIEFMRPLTYGDTVTIKTWVADFKNVRSRRAYDLSLTDTGEPVARAVTDWAYLDTNELRPVRIPAEMIDGFMTPDDDPPHNPGPRDRFPEPPQPPAGAYTQHINVQWRDLDQMQHVNNTVYPAYMEDTAFQASAHYGYDAKRLEELGVGFFYRRLRIEYKGQAVYGDKLAVTTYLAQARRASATRHFAIRRDGDDDVLARAYAKMAFVDVASGRIQRAPETMIKEFAEHIAVD